MMKKLYLKDIHFLKKIALIKEYDRQWRTSTGKIFQDIQIFYPNKWIGINPQVIYKYYKQNSEKKVLFMLVGNNLKSFSRGKIENIYISY